MRSFVTHLSPCCFSLQDDPVKGPMHSFLMSTNTQQEIMTLDNKVTHRILIISTFFMIRV